MDIGNTMLGFLNISNSPFGPVESFAELLTKLSLYLESNVKRKARIVVFHTSRRIEEIYGRDKSLRFKLLNGDKNIFLFEKKINVVGEKDNILNLKWLIFRANNSGVHIAITYESGKNFKRYVSKALSRYYPYISNIYISTKEIIELFSKMIKSNSFVSVRVDKMNLRKRIQSAGAQKQFASSLEWSDVPFEEVVDKVYSENAWIKSLQITMSFEENGDTSYSKFSIHRDGKFICSQNFMLFYMTVCKRVIEKAAYRQELLEKRGRKDDEKLAIKPLRVEFGEAVFSDKSEMERFRNALNTMKSVGLSVFHPNPYYKASLIDYKDGSSYTIWILDDSGVIISPGVRATVASLKRIYSHINENFVEGDVKDCHGYR